MTREIAGEFGTVEQQTVISVQAFVPYDSGQVFASTDTGYHAATSAGAAKLWAPLAVPAGADVESVCLEGQDFDSGNELDVSLVAVEAGTQSPGFTAPAKAVLAQKLTGVVETPGYDVFCVDPVAPFAFPLAVRAKADVDGLSGAHTAQYYVLVNLPYSPGNSVKAGAAVVRWQRAIPASPGVAMFADVPTGSPYFRYVEAAASSGVFVGCAPGLFCPDLPVTRAQLALYLARALGLYSSPF